MTNTTGSEIGALKGVMMAINSSLNYQNPQMNSMLSAAVSALASMFKTHAGKEFNLRKLTADVANRSNSSPEIARDVIIEAIGDGRLEMTNRFLIRFPKT